MNLDFLFFYFFIFSFAGWVLEAVYRSLRYGRPVNPGFHFGPYLPLYGFGALVLMATGLAVSGENIYVRALAYLLVTTVLEYCTGEALLFFFRER
jgi:uncharacterized protein